MLRVGRLQSRSSWPIRLITGAVVTFIMVGSMGPSCDSDASATFRETATSAIGDGVRTIMNGLLDGAIAAVEAVGDGGTSSEE